MSIKKSFSLVEVLIFVSILSLFLVTAASVITVSLHQNTLQINKLKATHYNDQLLEWIRGEKEIDWNTLLIQAGNNRYCFSNLNPSWGPTIIDSSQCPYDLDSLYRRYAVFATIGSAPSQQVEVTVYTEWQDGGNNYSTSLHTVLSPWQD